LAAVDWQEIPFLEMARLMAAAWPRFGRREANSLAEVQALAVRLREHVDQLAGVIGPRHLGKPHSLEAAAAYIEKQFADIGDATTRQTYRVDDHSEASNLVVERRGTKAPEQILVVGAHYDTLAATPGADDNASAVAMLIEVARRLAGVPMQRTVRFVSFPCEELPYAQTGSMGSQQYARECRKRGERLAGMICLEMVGFYSTTADSQKLPPGIPRVLRPLFPRRGDFLAAVGNLRSLRLLRSFRRGYRRMRCELPLFSIALPERIKEIRRSDNSSFWDQGYAALMITDTSFLRNPHYHQPSDTPQTLDYLRMARGTIGLEGAVAKLGRSLIRIVR
jgi:hypothetical protein